MLIFARAERETKKRETQYERQAKTDRDGERGRREVDGGGEEGDKEAKGGGDSGSKVLFNHDFPLSEPAESNPFT